MPPLHRVVLACLLTTACSDSSDGQQTDTDAGPGSETDADSGARSTARLEGDPIRLVIANDTEQPVLQSFSGPPASTDVPYAAFGFSTEPEPELAPPTFDESMNRPPAPAESSRYVATDLLSTEPLPDGTRYVLATDDPAGRELQVTVAKGADGTLAVTSEAVPGDGVTGLFASFACGETEAFHGFGGRRESTNLRGHRIANWVHDYRFPDVSTAYYYPQPMFLSSAGYALWLDTDRMASFRMASDRADAFRIAVGEAALKLVVAPHPGSEGSAAITARTGRHRVAPEWSMGATLSRTIQLPGETPESYRAHVEDDVRRILQGDLPIEAYAYEGWVMLPEHRVREINQQLRAAGVHPVLYLRSFLADDFAGTEPEGRFQEAVEAGYVAETPEGEPYVFPGPFLDADSAVVDFTNPEARAWWQKLVLEMLELGADGFMNDFGEQVLPDMVFADGSTGRAMHNRYPVLQHEAAREAVDRFVDEHPDREVYFFVRAGYSGSAAFENATFPGDESVNFDEETGLPSIVPDMLNRSIFGAWGFSTDIGGYADFEVRDGAFQGTDKELFMRWTEAAVFTTHFRVHNSALTGVRMPWSFDAETEAHFAEMARLHHRVVPTLRALWEEGLRTGLPPIRPLYLDDPEAGGNPHNDDQWLVGRDLLVAPVLERGATQREVWLPDGCWQLHGEGAELSGKQTVQVDAPLGVIPWYARCGTDPL